MYEKELGFAKHLASKAGELIRKNFVAIGSSEKIWKDDNSPLTITDTTINRMVLEAVEKEFPQHTLLGEEGSSTHNNTEFVWVCDPIDGTIPFSHGWPTSCFSLALCKEGNPVVGVAYDPYMDRLYSAISGGGAFVNSEKIRISNSATWEKNYVSLDLWPTSKFRLENAVPEMIHQGIVTMTLGSAVYQATLVASGNFLAHIFPGKTPWDAAATKIIVEEAGGKVTDLFGNDQRYDKEINGVLLSNGLVHDKLLNIISPYIK